MKAWLLVAALVATPAAAPEWRVGPAPSDFPELLAASVTNEAGDQLYVWPNHRDDRFQVFAEVHLAAPRAFGGTLPTYSIDGGPAVDVEQIRKQGEADFTFTAHVRGNVSLWLAWASPQGVIRKDTPLHAWLTGRTLVLRYTSQTGTAETASFPLAGAAEAIPQAAGVTAE